MKAVIFVFAFVALFLRIEAQNGTQWNQPPRNLSQWQVNQSQQNPAQNSSQWNQPSRNLSQWQVLLNQSQPNPGQGQTPNKVQSFNKSQWSAFVRPGQNSTQGNFTRIPTSNRTKWNITVQNRPGRTFNRTQTLNQVFNSTQQRAQNRTQWQSQSFDKVLQHNQNRSQTRLDFLNNSISNISAKNRTRNGFSVVRPKRSETKWIAPNTWNQTTPNGDVIVGKIGYLDRLLFNQTFRKESRWWAGREKIIEYPKIVKGRGQENITGIRIYNKFLDGLDSKAEILSGGVGYRYVKIKLSSPWNRGFEYLVQLFGR